MKNVITATVALAAAVFAGQALAQNGEAGNEVYQAPVASVARAQVADEARSASVVNGEAGPVVASVAGQADSRTRAQVRMANLQALRGDLSIGQHF